MVNLLTMAEMILGVLLLEAITRNDQPWKLLRLLLLHLQNATGIVWYCSLIIIHIFIVIQGVNVG